MTLNQLLYFEKITETQNMGRQLNCFIFLSQV